MSDPPKILIDPQENNPELRPILDAVEKEAQDNLKDFPYRMGFCQVFWAEKKRILREKFDIEWKSPAEMNPEVCFD